MDTAGNKGTAGFYMLDKDYFITLMVPRVTTSNGMAWGLDNGTFYYIDTPEQNVVSYDYDISTGNISDPKVIIEIPAGRGRPDGMTIDDRIVGADGK